MEIDNKYSYKITKVKHQNGSFFCTIPIEYAKELNLKKNDLILINIDKILIQTIP